MTYVSKLDERQGNEVTLTGKQAAEHANLSGSVRTWVLVIIGIKNNNLKQGDETGK